MEIQILFDALSPKDQKMVIRYIKFIENKKQLFSKFERLTGKLLNKNKKAELLLIEKMNGKLECRYVDIVNFTGVSKQMVQYYKVKVKK